jgi:hypothetical protein
MSIPSAIEAVCTMLQRATGLEILIGRPDEATPGVYVWPWRFEENRDVRSMAPFDPSRPVESRSSGFEVHFLVVITPSLTAAGLEGLAAVREALLAHPVLTSGSVSFELVPATLTIEESTRIFQAADLPLTICCAGLIRSAPSG